MPGTSLAGEVRARERPSSATRLSGWSRICGGLLRPPILTAQRMADAIDCSNDSSNA